MVAPKQTWESENPFLKKNPKIECDFDLQILVANRLPEDLRGNISEFGQDLRTVLVDTL